MSTLLYTYTFFFFFIFFIHNPWCLAHRLFRTNDYIHVHTTKPSNLSPYAWIYAYRQSGNAHAEWERKLRGDSYVAIYMCCMCKLCQPRNEIYGSRCWAHPREMALLTRICMCMYVTYVCALVFKWLYDFHKPPTLMLNKFIWLL